MPKVILPDINCPVFTYKEKLRNVEINHKIVKNDLFKNNSKKEGSKYQSNRNQLKYINIEFLGLSKREDRVTKPNKNTKIRESIKERLSVDKPDISKSPEENQIFDFTFSGLSENQTDPVQYKICGTTLEHVGLNYYFRKICSIIFAFLSPLVFSSFYFPIQEHLIHLGKIKNLGWEKRTLILLSVVSQMIHLSVLFLLR